MTQFLYDPGSKPGAGADELVAEYNGSGVLLRRYVHGLGTDDPVFWYEGGDRRSLLADHQGSIIGVADSAGASIAINAYDEWGVPNAGNTGRFQYTGQAWLPELGMYHYKARIYSPTLGRFLQTDPIGYEDQVNLYAYVGNDPVNLVDPSGEAAQLPAKFAVDLVIEVAIQYALTGRVDVRTAVADAAMGLVNPARTIDRAVDLARAASKTGVIYRRTDLNNPGGKPYIGRSNNDALFARRQNDHARSNPNARYVYEELDRVRPGRALREAEQREISRHGGPTNRSNPAGGTENRRNEIRQSRDSTSGDWSMDADRIVGNRGCGSRIRDAGC